MDFTEPSHWCHNCNSFVRVEEDGVVCVDCGGGFVEEINHQHHRRHRRRHHHHHHHHNHSHSHYSHTRVGSHAPDFNHAVGQSTADAMSFRPLFYPFIVLRRTDETGTYELLYDDGSGLGLRGLVPGMSELVMGPGFDRILEHFIHFDMLRVSHPPASKVAVDALPTIEINLDHVKSDTHCAVCTEPFEANAVARELPCKHLYHSDCILPWLQQRNSCPVCRHELPSEVADMDGLAAGEESMGLIIWRLPRGGYAVGRFNGGREVGENEVPDVYSQTDNVVDVNGSSQRRVIWSRSGSRRRGRGISQAFHNIRSFFSRSRSSPRQLNADIGFDDEVSRIISRRRAVV